MASVKSIENRVFRVEGFAIRILYETGQDVRSDRRGLKPYPFERQAKNSMNVKSWIDHRFRTTYQGFGVVVVTADGRQAHGNMLLATVRDTYLED